MLEMSDEKMKGTSSETSSHHESNASSNYSTSPTLHTHTHTHTHTQFKSSSLIKNEKNIMCFLHINFRPRNILM